jgi:hypothetical protein
MIKNKRIEVRILSSQQNPAFPPKEKPAQAEATEKGA